MPYYLRNKNEVLLNVDEFAGTSNVITSEINETTMSLQVLAFTTRTDAECFKTLHKVALRNFIVSNNLDYDK